MSEQSRGKNLQNNLEDEYKRGEGGGDGGEVVRAVMWTERTGRPASLAGKVEQRGALRLERGRGEHAPQGW